VTNMVFFSDAPKHEVERLKKVAIKPHWASDPYAQTIPIDVIASYRISSIPALTEISQQTFGLARKHALDRISQLNPVSGGLSQPTESSVTGSATKRVTGRFLRISAASSGDFVT